MTKSKRGKEHNKIRKSRLTRHARQTQNSLMNSVLCSSTCQSDGKSIHVTAEVQQNNGSEEYVTEEKENLDG